MSKYFPCGYTEVFKPQRGVIYKGRGIAPVQWFQNLFKPCRGEICRPFRAQKPIYPVTQGGALGYNMPRLWR